MVSGEGCHEGEEWGAVELPSKGGHLGFGRSPTRFPKINKIGANTQTCGHFIPTRQVQHLSNLRASGTAELLTKDVPNRLHVMCAWVAHCLPQISCIDTQSWLTFLFRTQSPTDFRVRARWPMLWDNRAEWWTEFALPGQLITPPLSERVGNRW